MLASVFTFGLDARSHLFGSSAAAGADVYGSPILLSLANRLS